MTEVQRSVPSSTAEPQTVITPMYVATTFNGPLTQHCSQTADSGNYLEFDGSQYHLHLTPSGARIYDALTGRTLSAIAAITAAVLVMLTTKGASMGSRVATPTCRRWSLRRSGARSSEQPST